MADKELFYQPRRYRSHADDSGPVELLVSRAPDGDWYLQIVREGHKFARLASGEEASIRVTTSGERAQHEGASLAVVDLYRALGGEARQRRVEEAMSLPTRQRDAWRAYGKATADLLNCDPIGDESAFDEAAQRGKAALDALELVDPEGARPLIEWLPNDGEPEEEASPQSRELDDVRAFGEACNTDLVRLMLACEDLVNIEQGLSPEPSRDHLIAISEAKTDPRERDFATNEVRRIFAALLYERKRADDLAGAVQRLHTLVAEVRERMRARHRESLGQAADPVDSRAAPEKT